MLLLRNKGQQSKTTVARFVTCLCRQRRGHKWAACSPLRDTRTGNLALVQSYRQANGHYRQRNGHFKN